MGFSLTTARFCPSPLAAEPTTLENRRRSGDVVDVLAACIRKRESALILLRHRDLVWPLTVFRQNELHHLPRPIIDARHNRQFLAGTTSSASTPTVASRSDEG